MENNSIDNIQIGDYTLKQWEEKANAPSPSTTVSFNDAEGLGLMQPESNQPQGQNEDGTNKFYNALDTIGVEHPDADKEYEKLGAWDTTVDVTKSLFTEASHIFAPKDKELKYESKTHFGENVKYGYRYIAGTAGFMFGGEILAGVKGLGLLGRVLAGTGKVLSGSKLIKTGANATKAAKIGAAIGNASLGGAAAGALADFTLYRPEENEGHLADVFGHTDNALLSYLQSNENDTDIDAKLKNVVEGLVMGIGIGNVVEFGAKPLFTKALKNLKALKEGKKGALEAVVQDQINLERFANKADLLDAVESIKAEADANGTEASQLLIDRLHPSDNPEAQQMLKVLNDGEEIFLHSDGTWDISINKWDEAYKVSPEEYKKQLIDRDTAVGGYAGDTAISHQDQAVRETWINRGWIGEGEDLTKTNANKIAKNYKDKFEIDNNIKVEFVDGLKIRGEAVEGNTTATKYQGKISKTKQNAIDKKKLQISKLEDKITMAEGGNKEVKDPLENLKEELRIAQNELKELEKGAKGKNKIPNITIQIDANAQNPYATLRAELEHARDIAKGEVPKQSDRHFSRYEGMNEGEVAPNYVYKKAQGKARALGLQNDMNDGQTLKNDVKYNQETFNEQRTNRNTTSTDELSRGKTGADGESNRIQSRNNNQGNDGNGLFIRRNDLWVVDTNSKNTFNNDKISYKELPQDIENGNSFYNAISQAKADLGDLGASVHTYTPEEYSQMKMFLSEDGLSGVAVKPDGDIVSVFVNPNAKAANYIGKGGGRGHALVELAKQNGGTKLDAFDTYLPDSYKKHNFVETGRDSWNEQYKPEGWNKEFYSKYNNGEPDVVYMQLRKELPKIETPQQLKLDFNKTLETKQSTGDIVSGIVNGEVKPQTKADIETIISKVEKLNPEISGFKWKNLTQDSEAFAKKLEEIFDEEDVSGLIEALTKGDIDDLEYIVRKEMAAVDVLNTLAEAGKKLGDNASIEAKEAIISTIRHTSEYITGIKSGFGRGLNSQKPINSLLESYGASRLSSWTKEGIRAFSETLINEVNDIISLNFTRGQRLNPQTMGQDLIRRLLEREDTRDFVSFLLQNEEMKADYVKEIQKLLANPRTANVDSMAESLTRLINSAEYNAMFKASQLAPDKKSFYKTITDWCDKQGGITSYYVHNLLSGVGSLAKNIGSGALNTIYFPARKILASLDPFIDQTTRESLGNEGWRTYKCMLTSWTESWQLMKEAFLTGTGKLTDIGENTLNMAEGQFKGYHELQKIDYYFENPSKFWEGMQNLHSIMTRAMGATDEFMSQLNYRAISRSKSLQEAERNAIEAGMKDNETWINEEADRIFKDKFDNHGQPTDVESLNEARTILYQNNLDGTMYNYQTGAKQQMRDPSFVMKLAGSLQGMANENAFMKCMFPFVKTGANILQMSLDHNAIYMAASPLQRKLLTAQTAEGALARSQCAFGMFSLAIGAMMAFNGMITGSAPADPKERKALFATGWKPYSFKIGDNYVSYQGYEPLHGMLGFAADCANMYSTITNPEDEARLKHFQAQILPTLVNNFLDKAAFRTGLSQLDLVLNPQDADEWGRAMAQTAKGFLPDVAFVTNTKSVGEHDVLQPKTFYERVFYRYFPDRWLPMDYRRNVFGEKQSITGLLISSVGHQDNNPEDEALEYLSKYGYSPSEIDDVIANTGLRISDFKDADIQRSAMDAMKEEMSMVTIQGMTLREAVRALVTSEDYQSLPDGVDLDTGVRWGTGVDTKINAINDVFLMYKQRAKKNIIENSENYVDSQGRTMEEASEDVRLKRLQQLNNLY